MAAPGDWGGWVNSGKVSEKSLDNRFNYLDSRVSQCRFSLYLKRDCVKKTPSCPLLHNIIYISPAIDL